MKSDATGGEIYKLATAISDWHDAQIASNIPTPDFWDEYRTSARLANFLISKGWKHVE